MKKPPWIGLVAAGPMSPAMFRMSDLHLHLGPVCSASLRVASRLANRLKAGTAAKREELGKAALILLTGPEAGIHELVRLAAESDIDWIGKTVILLDSRHDAGVLSSLGERGAAIGTLDILDELSSLQYAADVPEPSRRIVQRFCNATGAGVFFLNPGCKHVFSAGSAFTTALLLPLIAAAAECMKRAGLAHPEAVSIAERQSLQTIRAWVKAGRKGWTGPLSDRDFDAFQKQLEALGRENPILSSYLSHTAQLALRLFGEDAGWLEGPGSPKRLKAEGLNPAARLTDD